MVLKTHFEISHPFASISVMILLLATIPLITRTSVSAEDVSATSSVATHSVSGPDEVFASSGSNRFIVWYDNTPGNFEILFRRSTDNGATWQTTKNLSNNPGPSSNPQIAVSGSNVFVVWTQENADLSQSDIFFRRSADNGATWGARINISVSGINFSSVARLAASGSNVYISWTIGYSGEPRDTLLRRSTDNGATWSTIVNLSNNPVSNNQGPEIASSGNKVYVVWSAANEIYLRRSTDNGATWKSVVNLSKNAGDSRTPQIAVSGSFVYVAWSDFTPGNYDIFFRSSPDNGASWQPTKNLSRNAPYSSFPQISSTSSAVYVTWSQNRFVGSLNYDVMFKGSQDNGSTWGNRVTINSGALRISDQSLIGSRGDNVYVVWTENAAGETFFRRSTDNGATWITIVNLSNNSGRSAQPDFALSGSTLYVAWNNGGTSTEILTTRSIDNGATWEETVNVSDNSGGSFASQIGV
jgi:hypothetical protein